MSEAGVQSRNLDFGRVIGVSLGLYVRNFGLFTGLAFLFVYLPEAAFGLLRALGVIEVEADAWDAFMGAPGELLILSLAGLFFQGAVTAGCLEDAAGRRPSLSTCLSAAWRNFWPLFGISFLTNLAVILGLLVFIVPGVLLMVRWLLAPAIQVGEGAGVSRSLELSAKRTKGSRWRVFLLLLLSFLIGGLVLGVAAIPSLVMDLESGSYLWIESLAATPLSSTLLSLLSGVGLAAVYLQFSSGAGAGVAEVFE